MLALLAFAGACQAPREDRSRCLAELEQLGRILAENAHPGAVDFSRRMVSLRHVKAARLRHEEVSWMLVPALQLAYRLRRGDEPKHCQALLEEIGLMPPGSGDAAVTPEELRSLIARAALPETELLLPGPAPLPRWLWAP